MAKKYFVLLSQDQKQKDAEAVKFQVEEAELQLSADILETQRALAAAKSKMAGIKSSFPFDAKYAIEVAEEIKGYENGLKYLQEFKAELFTDSGEVAA